MTEVAAPSNVIEALSRVAAELPGIGKDGRASADQGGYAYRGIEAITQHAQPLLAKYGVVPVPRVVSWERDVVLVGRDRKEWHDERLQVEYDFFGPGGVTDKITVGPIPAIGRDGADKGANKAMTQAFKYALLQVLTIADKNDDNDGTTVEAEQPPTLISVTQVEELQTRLTAFMQRSGGAYPDRWQANNLPSVKSKYWSLLTVDDYAAAVALLTAAEEIVTAVAVDADGSPAPAAAVTSEPEVEASELATAGSPAPPSEYSDDETRPF